MDAKLPEACTKHLLMYVSLHSEIPLRH